MPIQEAQDKLEELRIALNRPMIISSGYRCPAYNKKVSHTGLDGPHTTGKAFDVKISGESAFLLVKLALEFGWTGVGVSQKDSMSSRFVHLDLLHYPAYPRPRIWSY